MPRDQPGAVLNTVAAVKQQMQYLLQGKVQTQDGSWLLLAVDSVCVHGDNPQAIQVVKELATLITAIHHYCDNGK